MLAKSALQGHLYCEKYKHNILYCEKYIKVSNTCFVAARVFTQDLSTEQVDWESAHLMDSK